MARRADPERVHQAPRAAIRNGLTDYGMSLFAVGQIARAIGEPRRASGHRRERGGWPGADLGQQVVLIG